jgi:hypothetical protein
VNPSGAEGYRISDVPSVAGSALIVVVPAGRNIEDFAAVDEYGIVLSK